MSSCMTPRSGCFRAGGSAIMGAALALFLLAATTASPSHAGGQLAELLADYAQAPLQSGGRVSEVLVEARNTVRSVPPDLAEMLIAASMDDQVAIARIRLFLGRDAAQPREIFLRAIIALDEVVSFPGITANLRLAAVNTIIDLYQLELGDWLRASYLEEALIDGETGIPFDAATLLNQEQEGESGGLEPLRAINLAQLAEAGILEQAQISELLALENDFDVLALQALNREVVPAAGENAEIAQNLENQVTIRRNPTLPISEPGPGEPGGQSEVVIPVEDEESGQSPS